MQSGWKRRTLNLGRLVVKSEEKARCRICKKDIELSNMARQALISYCNGKKHKESDVKIESFFQPVNKSLDNPVKVSENETELVNLNKLIHPKPKRHLKLYLQIPKKLRLRFYGHLIQYHQIIPITVARIILNCSKVCFLTAELQTSFKWTLFCKLRKSFIF